MPSSLTATLIRVFPCRGQDRWIAISVCSDAQWLSLTQAMDRSDLARNPRFDTLEHRKANEDELEHIVANWTRGYDAHELMSKLQAAGVAAGAVQDASDLLERDPQLQARGFLADAEHPVLGTFGHQTPPYKLSATPGQVRRAPLLGEHTRDVCLQDLHFTQAEFEQMQSSGAFT